VVGASDGVVVGGVVGASVGDTVGGVVGASVGALVVGASVGDTVGAGATQLQIRSRASVLEQEKEKKTPGLSPTQLSRAPLKLL